MQRILSLTAVGAVSLLVGQVAASAATTVHWHDLRSVRVTVTAPSLPPPGDKPQTTLFTPGHGLSGARRALNHNHIMRLVKGLPYSRGCAGGYEVTIKIVKHDFARVTMSGGVCGTTFGHIGGNLPGFLHSVGITPP